MTSSTSNNSMARIILVLFFLSGATSLVFETIFTRLLTYTFGNTAHAVSTVLAAFLGGLALGAYIFGRIVDRWAPSLWIYGVLEVLVALYGLLVPGLFAGLTTVYVDLYHRFDLSLTTLTAVRFCLAGVVVLIPTVLMGGTLPALARYVVRRKSALANEITLLYTVNIIGAASGTLISTYLFLPHLGVQRTIWLACGVNGLIFLAVAAISSRQKAEVETPDEAPTPPAEELPVASYPQVRAVLLIAAILTGALALTYEVIWTHVLAFLVGNTVYAFGMMLFTFLCGLAIGARVVATRLSKSSVGVPALVISQIALGLAVLLTVPLWNRVPDLFQNGIPGALQHVTLGVGFLILLRVIVLVVRLRRRMRNSKSDAGGLTKTTVEFAVWILALFALLASDKAWIWTQESTPFVIAELLRFFSAFYLIIIPAVLIGLGFPLLLNLYARLGGGVGRRVGGIYAANTLGSIAGAVAAGFFLVPLFGSLPTLRGAAVMNIAIGVLLAATLAGLSVSRRWLIAAVSTTTAVLLCLAIPSWDPVRLTRGSYVYFNEGWPIDELLYFKEDTQGGLTSVIRAGPNRILLSNGKFQGNNTGEVPEQIRMALIPLVFTRQFDRALVIGLGTGNTLRAMSHFPFGRIDVAELAPHIVEAAREWFEDVNDGVFDRDPRVNLQITDGRNLLLLSRDPYDLISIEVSSIWIAGEADLYNKEFYELCLRQLKPGGILQQWVQIHHMPTRDLLVILNTAAQVFPHLAFFYGTEQGILIASDQPLETDFNLIRSFDNDPDIRKELEILNIGSLFSLLGDLVLHEDTFRKAVAELPKVSDLPADFVSTDFLPFLEYQTPKGNSLPYNTVPVNLNFLRKFMPPSLPPIRNLPSENDLNLIYGYIATERKDFVAAREFLGRVGNPLSARAMAELERIEEMEKEITPP